MKKLHFFMVFWQNFCYLRNLANWLVKYILRKFHWGKDPYIRQVLPPSLTCRRKNQADMGQYFLLSRCDSCSCPCKRFVQTVLFVHVTGQFSSAPWSNHRSFAESCDHIVLVFFLPVFTGVQAFHSEEPWILIIISAKKVEHPTKLPVVRTTSS